MSVTNFSKKLREALHDKRMTQGQLAALLKVSEPSVNRWVHGINEPRLETISRIAQVLKLPVPYFLQLTEPVTVREMGSEYTIPAGAIPLSESEYIYLPVFAKISCSLPEFSNQDIAMRQPVPRFVYTTIYPGVEYVVLAKGDSMSPTIQDGALCYIKPCTHPKNGAIMLVKFEDSQNDGFTIKIVRIHKDRVELEPINKKHKTITCNDGVCRVIGLVVGISQPAPEYIEEGKE